MKATKGVIFKRGDKIFWMAEASDQEDGESVEEFSDNDEDFRAIFALNERRISIPRRSAPVVKHSTMCTYATGVQRQMY